MEFSVLKSDGSVIFSGTADKKVVNESAKETDYIGEFSKVEEPGKYYVTAKGLGESDTFEIGDGVYLPVFQKAMHFFYLKSIALIRLGKVSDAESINGQWLSSLREHNESVDSRCRYALACSSFALDKPFMGDMQSFIRHNRSYLPGIETLRKMMHEKKLTLETYDENRSLVDVFNGSDGNLSAAWRNSSSKARQVLLRAIFDYPYE